MFDHVSDRFSHLSNRFLGVPKPGCFKPGCLQILRKDALLRSFADLRLRSFAVICALLRAFACFCVRLHLERPPLGTAEFFRVKLKKHRRQFRSAGMSP